MDDDIKDITPNEENEAVEDGNKEENNETAEEQAGNDDVTNVHSDYRPVNRFDASAVHHLSGMYQNWFLDYASYVILERAVPHIEDGLKPVQRRVLHSMKRMDDGRYNKVANIVGHTMQFHPHGDASIGDALVQLGQKDLLVDTQGNWGNILTGSSAAAPRYIEARLSKFALDVVFNPKTTEWKMSYDGRTTLHRGTSVEIRPRCGIQSQDNGVEDELRRAQQGTDNAAREVPFAAGARRRGHRRRSLLKDSAT